MVCTVRPGRDERERNGNCFSSEFVMTRKIELVGGHVALGGS